MSTTSPSAARDPVLRTPYEAPANHWRLNPKGRSLDATDPGRRPSLPGIGMPAPAQPRSLYGGPRRQSEAAETDRPPGWVNGESEVEPHRTINELRGLVADWRGRDWPGVASPTRRLLEFWSAPPGGVPMRPFWCQLEAVETIIWLLEAGPRTEPRRCPAIHDRLRKTNREWNEGVPRLALKLATGTGKTHLMAMLALWWTSRTEGPVHFLAVAPNLTVRDGLRKSLDPQEEHPLWDSITPRGFERVRRRMRWSVLNFQKFQRRKNPEGMDGATGKEKKFLTGGLPFPSGWEEGEAAMLARLLDRTHAPKARFVVFNDEAHHCYAPAPAPGKLDAEERREQQTAALWFSALAALHRAGRLEQVLDFSATPMWLKKPAHLDSEIFPWTVSDFPLLDAIESGLVKVPRVPVADDTDSHEPRYRNIYLFAGKKDCRVGELQAEIREPLEQLYEHYETRISPVYEHAGVLPIFIVVANKVVNAERIHRWIAGEPRREGVATPGNLGLLSNYEPDGTPKAHPPTVLVHSRLFDADPPTSGKLATAIEEQAALHAPGAKTKAEKQEAIRRIFMTTGREGKPGEHIRCVVSVGMLTEGWDARNVTHIFGYRRFGSLLLCEQVTGRALRRTSFTGTDEKQKPEYANVFGVPYTFARADGPDDPQPAIQPWRVYTVPRRAGFRIAFPQVVGFAPPEQIRRWRLNPAKVEAHVVPPRPTPGQTDEAGAAGKEEEFRRADRPETDLWRAAGQVAVLLDPHRGQRRTTFADALRAVREWLALPQIDGSNRSGLPFDSRGIARIADACDVEEMEAAWRPVFADERDRAAPRVRDTGAVDFETVLRRCDARHSELNAAACHSHAEVELARILDDHPGIEAWARNFRLGWEAPWFDAELDDWRRTEPDFVARCAGQRGRRRSMGPALHTSGRASSGAPASRPAGGSSPATAAGGHGPWASRPTVRRHGGDVGTRRPKEGGEPDLHLVIEFKGMKAGEASEEAKRAWLARWCEAVSAHGEFGRWRLVWIESLVGASALIERAIAGREDA